MNAQNEKALRLLIKEAIKRKIQLQNEQRLNEEQQLRQIIKHLITEVDADTNPAPYESTALNALADALNQILPVLETGLRKLKRPEERQSYRAHVLQKFQSIFDTFEALDAGSSKKIGEGPVNEQEDDAVTIKIDDDARVMPSDGKEDDRFKDQKPDLDADEKDLEDLVIGTEDPTGARRAFNTINNSNIEKLLADTRKLLVRPEDRAEFKEYALYNVDLWLLSYEKDIADENGEPPAFDKVIMPKPEGAEVQGAAQEFESGEPEVEDEVEDEVEEDEGISLPSIAEFE
tara:strand:+ start:5692 stop:6558 length:867 start_codon:yes stop_codon:yes gene_type:complete